MRERDVLVRAVLRDQVLGERASIAPESGFLVDGRGEINGDAHRESPSS